MEMRLEFLEDSSNSHCYLSFAKKLPKAAPKTQHLDKAIQIAGQGSINLPGSQAAQTRSSE
jgi:hypothetical protein